MPSRSIPIVRATFAAVSSKTAAVVRLSRMIADDHARSSCILPQAMLPRLRPEHPNRPSTGSRPPYSSNPAAIHLDSPFSAITTLPTPHLGGLRPTRAPESRGRCSRCRFNVESAAPRAERRALLGLRSSRAFGLSSGARIGPPAFFWALPLQAIGPRAEPTLFPWVRSTAIDGCPPRSPF